MAVDPVLGLEGVRKTYRTEAVPVHALRGVDLSIERGEFVAIVGASGSGKSTLLHIMGILDRPTRGRVLVDGTSIKGRSDNELAAIRGRRIGFVFQAFNLYPTLTAWENVALPMLIQHIPRGRRHRRALRLLEQVGLAGRAHHLPGQLSGGQKQRVAIARALANEPAFLLADEPTGNLDSKSSDDIMTILRGLHAQGTTLVIVTHDSDVSRLAERLVVLKDGSIDRQEVRHAS